MFNSQTMILTGLIMRETTNGLRSLPLDHQDINNRRIIDKCLIRQL